MHIYRITGCIACKLLRDESPWLVTSVGARARACARAHTHAQYPPLSAHIATGIQVDAVARHSSPSWLPLQRFFHPFSTEATDSIRGNEIKDDATYESRCDFPRLGRWACLEWMASPDIGMIPSDRCARMLDDLLPFRRFFLFLSSVDISRKRANFETCFVIWKLIWETYQL